MTPCMRCGEAHPPKTQYEFELPFAIIDAHSSRVCQSLIIVTVAAEFTSPQDKTLNLCQTCARLISKDVLSSGLELSGHTVKIEQSLN